MEGAVNDRERIERNVMRRMNIGDIPKRTAAKYPDRVALAYGERRVTFRELNENCCRMAHVFEDLGISRDDVALLSIPLYHVAGKYLLLEFINLGGKLVLEYAPNPVEILELTQKERITYWVYPPTLYQVLPSMPDFDSYDLSSLKKYISFGAVMPVPLLQQWKNMFHLGGKLVLEYAPNPVEILELTQKERITYWVYPPTLYQVLPSMPDFDSYDLSSLKKYISFGAVMPVPLLQQWKNMFPDSEWRNYYGQTESAPLGSTLQPEDFETKIDSTGRPHLGVEIKIFDDNEVPVGEVGEIVMRSPSVMKGYYKLEEKTAETLRGGWLHTDDLGRFDEDGFLYFVDRKEDMIKTGGENVASKEVEDVLFKHEKVMQVAVIGLPDEYWMEAVTAVVVPYPGVEVTEDEIIACVKENLAGYKVPKRVIIMAMEDMPVLPSGKILKREPRDRLSKPQ